MIIGSGSLKGRSLKTLGKEPWLRPTSDKAREAVMDMLRPVLPGAKFIDLCCGTGAVGIEAASNGAGQVTFVDADNRSIRLVRENIKLLGSAMPTAVLKADATSYVQELQGSEFDVLFCDPPFDSGLQESLLAELALHLREMADGCIIIMEHASRRRLPERYEGPQVALVSYRERRYGDVSMTFFRVRARSSAAGEGERGETAD